MPQFSYLSRVIAAALSVAAMSAPVFAQTNGLAGAYLAARQASGDDNYDASAQYSVQAIARDPSNPALMDNAIVAFLGLGQADRAVPIARRMDQGGFDSQVSSMVMAAEAMKRGAFDDLLADFEAGRSIGPLVDSLLKAWSLYGDGRMSEALDMFDDTAKDKGLEAFGTYHKALALAAVGDYEGAEALFSGDLARVMRSSRRGALANLQILTQLDRFDDAIALLDELFGYELDPGMAALRARLEAGEKLPYTTIRNAADGGAEVFFTVASVLRGEAADTVTLMYSRVAEYLREDHVDAILMSAGVLEQQENHALATEAYRRVPADDPAFYMAELGLAGTLEAQGEEEAAVEVLSRLAKTYPDLAIVHVTFGDMLNRMKRYDEAVRAYDKAESLFPETEAQQWIVYYSRAIAHERQDQWPEAEADFLKALELSPEQPRVLNYLGYSYVEKQEKLDIALDMIERAVAARPDSGYIVDSLGWVLYRLGRYEEAVPHMERAVELMPIDPIVNDHLGDVLWAVGRRVEAEFQWRRALSFLNDDEPNPDIDADRVRRKLELGLDAVLIDEGKEPVSVANGN